MYEQMIFSTEDDFRNWLDENYNKSDGIWMVFGKTDELVTLTYDEALRQALCYGWIDGLIKRVDDVKYLRKFTPRRKNSKWSKRNKEIIAELIKLKLVQPSGYEAIDRAKKEGVWETRERVSVSDDDIMDFEEKIKKRQPAYDNFIKMPPSVRRTYTMYYMDAKKEQTRKNRLEKIVERLNKNLKPM